MLNRYVYGIFFALLLLLTNSFAETLKDEYEDNIGAVHREYTNAMTDACGGDCSFNPTKKFLTKESRESCESACVKCAEEKISGNEWTFNENWTVEEFKAKRSSRFKIISTCVKKAIDETPVQQQTKIQPPVHVRDPTTKYSVGHSAGE